MKEELCPNPDFEERSRDLAAQLSEDLQGYTELQLDVREELHGHLLDAFEIAQSHCDNDQEAAEQVLEHFGPSAELPQMLVQGNLKRMKSRTRIKWLLTYAFIPLILLLALGLGYREWREFQELKWSKEDSYSSLPAC